MTAEFAVHEGATVVCAHPPGQARPTIVSGRVRVDGRHAVTLDAPWTVVGCPAPCLSATWTTGSLRVTSMGMPLVVQGGIAVCAPTSSPLTVLQVQMRVRVQ